MSNLSPGEYVIQHYRRDYDVATELHIGSCALSISGAFTTKARKGFTDLRAFWCCQYAINLVDQGLHSYMPRYYRRWNAPYPYINFRDSYCHWVGAGTPISIIAVLEAMKGKDPQLWGCIPKEKDLEVYAQYFFNEIFTAWLQESGFPVDVATRLKTVLSVDEDCPEVRSYLAS